MQCTSYIPVYYHARDLNVGASGFSWPLFNSNPSYGEEGGFQSSLPPCTMDQYLSYDKEVLRQIIQNHEATFRYQVHELHRVYRRQRELMDEMRVREIFAQHLLSQTSESVYCSSHAWSEVSQSKSHATSWLLGDHSHGKLPELTSQSIQRPPTFGAANFQEHTTVCPGPSVRKNSYNEVKFPASRNQGNEKRILDLELPADMYHDEGGKQFKEGNLSEAPEITCNTPQKLSNIPPKSDSEIDSDKAGDLSSFQLHRRKTNCFIDLNEPIQLGSQPSSSTGPFETYICPMEVMHNDPCVSGEATGLLNSDDSSNGITFSVDIDLNSMPANCFSETESILENLRTINKETTVVPSCSSVYDHARKKEGDGENPVADIDDKFLKTKTCIDLNTGTVVHEPSPQQSSTIVLIKSAGDTDLEGPVSPENEECSPPRGKSEDIQLETSPLLSEQREGEPSMELDTIAAETLVTISSCGVQEYIKAANPEPLESFRNHLYWFAEIVSSTRDDLENKAMKVQNYTTDTAVNLSDVVKKEEETGDLSGRSKKGHARGTRQLKDIRTEVLPSLSSLSKSLHTIEGCPRIGSAKRNPGKKAHAKPRRYSKLSTSSIMKQHATQSKEGCLQGWGKIRKRQGGRRRRTSKFPVITTARFVGAK
ncbi:hypothetical protein Salat_1556500 [Sesamum alatum]|uniref:Uncharacterized protein n=1 Tax=Sesamum alatum TaxID=300844 RepID=A0AAE1YD05_9LAMI|nr:hypothetical protein Salat_1556500 [Sesamum alatum]